MNNLKKFLCVVGTPPEAIKMIPIIKELQGSDWAECMVVATAEHRDMLDQVFDFFNVQSHYDLNLMKDQQGLNGIIAKMLPAIEHIITQERPYVIIAQGDTATVFGTALAAFHHKIPFAHIEAGLRTNNLDHPFPEEGYRQMISRISHWNFAPSELAAKYLREEGVKEEKIFIPGNTCIDTLLMTVKQLPPVPISTDRIIVLTAHRRENFGKPLENIFRAILKIVEDFDDIKVIYPVHPDPNVKKLAYSLLDHPRIILKEPLNYFYFVDLLRQAHLILTDSGGIQEEAPALGKPVLVIRETTERPEPIQYGVSKIIGTDSQNIYKEVSNILLNENIYRQMSTPCFPYGDGKAAKEILSILESYSDL